MPFDEFMEACLYDASHGYFSAGDVRPGEQGDFVTAPEVSPHFGRLIGAWIGEQVTGRDPRDWVVVEVGAGSGSLMEPALDVIGDRWAVVAVERSEDARRRLRDRLNGVEVVGSVRDVDAPNALVVMNEVLDNAPTALARRTSDGWGEVAVGIDDDGELTLVDTPIRDATLDLCELHFGDAAIGRIIAVPTGAVRLLDGLATQFDGLSLCVVDYGGTTEDLLQRSEDTVVRTYRHQHTGFDFLRHPGETDITVDMNTDVVSAALEHHGLAVSSMTQADFLESLGASVDVAELVSLEHSRAAEGDVMGQLTVRSEAVGLRALLDSQGFGSFRVVIGNREPQDTGSTSNG